MQSSQTSTESLRRVGIFNVRVVLHGDGYGLNDCRVHDHEDPLVEFYDARQSVDKYGPRGQFVTRYFASTLMSRGIPSDGLLLDTGSGDWVVSSAGMDEVVAHIRSVLAGAPSDADYRGCEIHVSPNRDQHRGGFEWSICKDGAVLDDGLDVTEENARESARSAIDKLHDGSVLGGPPADRGQDPSGVAGAGEYFELEVTMRSKTTFGTDKATIRVWDGQSAREVAERAAQGYGASVEEMRHPDGTLYVEPEKAADYPRAGM